MVIMMKFGGTSVGSVESINNIVQIVKERLHKQPIIVISAISQTTNALILCLDNIRTFEEHYDFVVKRQSEIIEGLGLKIDIVNSLFEELKKTLEQLREEHNTSKKSYDLVTSFGERMSVRIISAYLTKQGIPSEPHNAYDLGLVTNSKFMSAHPLDESVPIIKEALEGIDHIPIITGFIAKNKEGEITTLGRGGSDFSAAYIGSAVDVEEIQIWTDVDGILSADPRIIKGTQFIPEISFREAAELAYFGAKVVHPKTIIPAIEKNISVRILNTYNPSGKGTLITQTPKVSKGIVKAITEKKGITLVNIMSTRMLFAHGFLQKIFTTFDKYETSVDIVTTSEVAVSISLDNLECIDEISEELSQHGRVRIIGNKSIVCLVGQGMQSDVGIFRDVFSLLAKNNLNVDVISQGASRVNLTFVVDDKDADNVVQLLHNHFIGELNKE